MCHKCSCKKYQIENKQKISERKRRKYTKSTDLDRLAQRNYWNSWYKTNSEQYNTKQKERYNQDSHYKLTKNLRSRFWHALKKATKSISIIELTGCSLEELKAHLESQFTEGMSWENHGEWHIDHIRPCASFDLTDPEQQKLCFHYSNLQPLWAVDNLKKSDKY